MGKHSQRKHEPPKRTGRALGFWLIALLTLSVAATALIGFYSRSAARVQNAVPVRISMSGFTPAEIRATAGQPIQIELINLDNSHHTDGGGWHNFVVDDLDVAERVAPESRRLFTFTPTQPGEYDFYCDICCGGKENPYMHGRLIVS